MRDRMNSRRCAKAGGFRRARGEIVDPMEIVLQSGGARVLWQAQLPENTVGLAWLGQAGFMLRHAQRGWLIDPYLSDHMAHKYAGTEF